MMTPREEWETDFEVFTSSCCPDLIVGSQDEELARLFFAGGWKSRIKEPPAHSCLAYNEDEEAVCVICKREMGWWCPKSLNHVCAYDPGCERCCYCGLPRERK